MIRSGSRGCVCRGGSRPASWASADEQVIQRIREGACVGQNAALDIDACPEHVAAQLTARGLRRIVGAKTLEVVFASAQSGVHPGAWGREILHAASACLMTVTTDSRCEARHGQERCVARTSDVGVG